ncbi:MAG: hypothetical protein WBG43_03285 [Marinifilaceae bacterium]
MKGIIVDYIENKGFGFIMDENKEKRFFHISDVNKKDIFLGNITDYYYTDFIERKCYVVDFKSGENGKGLSAIDINMTNQIFNDKSKEYEYKAKIVDLKYHVDFLTRTVSGIKQEMSAPLGSTAGGNGTYRVGYPEVLKELNIYFHRIDDIGWDVIDVRELVLTINNRSKITDKFVTTLKKRLVGEIITIYPKNNEWFIDDNSILKI